MTPTPGGRRRRRLVWAALAIVSLGLAVVAVVVLTERPGDVSNPDVAFDTAPSQAPTTPAPAPEPDGTAKDPFDDGFEWPTYGLTKSRTKYLGLSQPLRPPFVVRWRMTGRILLEFPPVLCGRQLFLLKNNGALYAVSRRSGKVRWKRKLGYLAASSPACSHGTVYVTLLEHTKGAGAGRVVAVRASDGRPRWSRKLPSRSESSPLIDQGRLYFGSEDGTVYALRTSDGAVRWTYRSGGAVKAGLALDNGKLFFGDYAGQVTAIRRADGKRVWRSSGAGRGVLGSGTFYGTPAVAYGRVYVGSTDGFMYSFSTIDGKLAWRHKTGGYVYSSPAISPVRGGTVYAGSYDGKLYAFDARSGNVKWTRNTGGKLSGGIQVVGDLVFYANLSRRSIGAVGAANGNLVWSIGRGGFNPLIADSRRLYVVGYSSLFMLTEKGRRTDGTLTSTERDSRSEAARKRAVARRVAARRAAVHRALRLRAKGQRVCYRSAGKRVCRLPRPPVCFKRESDDRTVCRARRR
jgi:outer membrane protein assembly factor BamB